jgi:two-component system, OmpR family, phosphate regulon sensor histidine kinase PhoR
MQTDIVHTILVVDDEKVIRDGCSRLLSREGYRVLTAVNGQEALGMLATEPVNLILCDLVMPVMGAFEVLEEVKVKHPELPLIIITGHGTVSNAVEAMKKGAYDFITKPFRADHMSLVIKRALDKQTLERRARELQDAQAQNLYDLAIEKSRIRSIINCMADGVLVTNRELEIVLHNPALTRLLELPGSFDSPTALSACLPDEDLEQGLRSLLEMGHEESGLISRELQQGNRTIHALSAPVPGLNGQVLGTVTVFQDITTFKELDEMKSNFIQMVSHELRSPLASIKQLLTVVLDGLAGETTEKQKELLGRSQLKIQSLLNLINDLLDVAKIESGHAFQQLVPLHLAEVLDQTVALLRPRAESHKVALLVELPPDLPLIQADPRSMEELFTNLISNAVHYSPDGGKVNICAVSHGDYLEVLVTDTGVGIEAEEIPKIFDKFYRVKHPKTRQVIGTGLGLAIVKGIVESHRGSIEVESEPGVGTTFRVLLPAIM